MGNDDTEIKFGRKQTEFGCENRMIIYKKELFNDKIATIFINTKVKTFRMDKSRK